MFGMGEPLCERESIGGLHAKAWEELGEGGFDCFAAVLVRSSIENVCLFGLPGFLHDHDFGNRFLEAIVSGVRAVWSSLSAVLVGRVYCLKFDIQRWGVDQPRRGGSLISWSESLLPKTRNSSINPSLKPRSRMRSPRRICGFPPPLIARVR